MLKFFAVMLVLTLAARGIAGASMPVVTLTSAAASSITQSSTAAGTIAVRGGTPLLVPEGVLVTEVSAAAGQSLQAGDVIARFDAASLAQALAARQAQVRQLETTAAQLQDPETADRFALQQASSSWTGPTPMRKRPGRRARRPSPRPAPGGTVPKARCARCKASRPPRRRVPRPSASSRSPPRRRSWTPPRPP